MIYFVWVASFLCIGFGLSVLLKRPLEQTFVLGLMGAIVLLYVTGIFFSLTVAVVCVFACAVSSAIFVGITAVKNKTIFRALWLTPGCLMLALFLIYICWMQAGKVAIGNDEFSHWALVVKVMYNHNELSIFHADELMFGSYPPATGLLEYLFVCLMPAFYEGNIYRALMLLQVSILLPVMYSVPWKKAGSAIAGLIGMFLLALPFNSYFYSDLSVDGVLALEFFYLLYLWFTNRQWNQYTIVAFSLGSAVLVLTKESGSLFVMFAFLTVLWDGLTTSHSEEAKTKLIWLKRFLIPLFSASLAHFSWRMLIQVSGLASKETSSAGENIKTLLSPWPQKYISIVGDFFVRMFSSKQEDSTLNFSMAAWMLIGFFALYFLFAITKEKVYKRYLVSLCVSAVTYSLGLLYLYFFHFGDYEGTRLASLERYMSSFLYGLVLLAAALWMDHLINRNHHEGLIAILILSLLVLPGESDALNRLFNPSKANVNNWEFRNSYLTPQTFPAKWDESDQIYFVAEDTQGYEALCANYSFYSNRISSPLGYNFNTENEETALWANQVSAEEWAECLKEDFSYVFIRRYSDTFIEKYGELFEDQDAIEFGTLFEVQSSADGIILVRVYP